jgi:glycosyltransferase involved in cell wall biosynthesis
MIHVHIPANLFYPELPGGSLQYFRYAPFLYERGVQVHVHTARKPHHEVAEFEIRTIKVRRYEVPAKASLLGELEFLTERAMEASELSQNKAVIQPIGTSGASPRSVLRLWRARLRGLPSCFHFTDVPIRQQHRFPGNLKEIVRMRLQLSPYGRLLMCSHVMGRAFETYCGVSPRRITAVPNGIDLSVFSPVPDEKKRKLRKQLDLPVDSPIILYVGSVIARKGVDILIEAWKTVNARKPGARLVIVGSTRPRPTVRDLKARSESELYFSEIGEQIDQLDHPQSVIFAGEVDNVRDYYRACDLFAFASRHEGLPSVVMEAMACGVSCVVAPFIGIPADGEEYGTSGEHFVKSTHEPAQMADDILRLIGDPDARAKMGQAAAEWIAETQEMGKAADQLAAVYRNITGSH